MLGKVFKAYDVRAVYPKPLNEKLAWQIGYAAGQYLTGEAREAGHDDPMMQHVIVGRDMRKSSPSLSDSLKQGIRDFGAHVIDVGLVDTPLLYFAINHLGCCGGVQVTASHNPAIYNGFKISKIHARPVGMETGLESIRRYAALIDRDKHVPRNGREDERDLWETYREHCLQNLDAALRVRMRTELQAILRAADATAVFVTHDQEEALSIADRIAVMREGRILQVDTPSELYAHPHDAFVASFVGGADLLPATSDGTVVDSPIGDLVAAPGASAGPVSAVLRPEQVRVWLDGQGLGRVCRFEYFGHDQLVTVELGDGLTVRSRLGPGRVLVRGDRVSVAVAGTVLVFPVRTAVR